jgi:hypothetical protein
VSLVRGSRLLPSLPSWLTPAATGRCGTVIASGVRAHGAAFPGAAEELDVTMFEPGPQLAAAERAAAELVAKARVALALRLSWGRGGFGGVSEL